MAAYGTQVHSFCMRVLGDSVLVDDVFQEVFVQAHESLPTYRRQARLLSWLLGIANHRCLDAIKARRRQINRYAELELEHEPDGHAGVLVADALELLHEGRMSVALEKCLAELPPRARAAVLLRYHHGLSYEEMGRMLREKPATLQARVARALPVLRECLLARGLKP